MADIICVFPPIVYANVMRHVRNGDHNVYSWLEKAITEEKLELAVFVHLELYEFINCNYNDLNKKNSRLGATLMWKLIVTWKAHSV